MKLVTNVSLAVMAVAIATSINIKPANAQSRTWRRDGAAPAAGGDMCVSVDRAVVTLEALCKNPAYANCARCKQMAPCLNGCTPGGTATPPGGPVTYAYSQECAPNQPEVAGCKVEDGKVSCAAHYFPVTVGTRSLGSSGNVRSIVLQKRCLAGDRSEAEIAEINKQIQKLIEADRRFAEMLKKFGDRLDKVEAEVAAMRDKIAEARQMAISALVKVHELKGRVDAIENGLVELDQQLQRVMLATLRAGLGLEGAVWHRGRAGTLYGGGLVFSLNAWVSESVGFYTMGNLSIYKGDGINRQTAGEDKLYSAGARGGLAFRASRSSDLHFQVGFGVNQTFQFGTPNFYGALYGANAGIYYAPKGTPISIGVDGMAGAGGAMWWRAPGVAGKDNGFQGQAGLVLKLTTDDLLK